MTYMFLPKRRGDALRKPLNAVCLRQQEENPFPAGSRVAPQPVLESRHRTSRGRGRSAGRRAPRGLRRETDITLITEQGPHYRGQNAVRLSETRSVEDVAALLWQADRSAVFTKALPNAPAQLPEMLRLFSEPAPRIAPQRCSVQEIANPRAYDSVAMACARPALTCFVGWRRSWSKHTPEQ